MSPVQRTWELSAAPLSLECTPSLPSLSCPFPVLPALASQPAAPWLLLEVLFTETEEDSDLRGEGSGNHRLGASWSLNAWGGCIPYIDEKTEAQKGSPNG